MYAELLLLLSLLVILTLRAAVSLSRRRRPIAWSARARTHPPSPGETVMMEEEAMLASR